MLDQGDGNSRIGRRQRIGNWGRKERGEDDRKEDRAEGEEDRKERVLSKEGREGKKGLKKEGKQEGKKTARKED